MNLEEKLYQLIISRLDGDRIPDKEYQDGIFALVHKGIGGFIIFGGKKEIVKTFISQLQTIANIPLFIASDIERGVGQQIGGYTDFPCQMAVRAAINRNAPEDMVLLKELVRALAHEAIDAGINMPLIPVLDVNSNADNPIICTRAFSDDPEDAAFFGSEYIRALEQLNLISCAKHFPGHGDTAMDSHLSLPVIKKSFDELFNTDIRPFIEAVRTGVSSIMVGHLLIPAVDESDPASLSKKVITGLLRNGLGYDGLIMTDAMNMSAISGIENSAARCINSGVDIILHPQDADSTVSGLKEAFRASHVTGGSIDDAVGRIIKAKAKIPKIRQVELDPEVHSRVSELATEKSVTLLKETEGALPLTEDGKIQVLIAGETGLCDQTLWINHFQNVHILADYDDRRNNRKAVSTCEIVIIAIFSKVAAWRGTAGIGDREIRQLLEIVRMAGESVVISFGSPYILRHFNEAENLIAAYESGVVAQKAVIKCLKGDIHFRGRMPVRL